MIRVLFIRSKTNDFDKTSIHSVINACLLTKNTFSQAFFAFRCLKHIRVFSNKTEHFFYPAIYFFGLLNTKVLNDILK